MQANNNNNEMIFISIAAYRDTELWPTITDCIAKAASPDKLHITVLEQSPEPSNNNSSGLSRLNQFSYIHLHNKYSRGPCWARSLISSYIRDESYFLQIDSHMRFDEGWDDFLRNSLKAVSNDNPKAIISTYPCAYSIVNGESVNHPMLNHSLVLKPRPDAVLTQQSPVIPFYAVPAVSKEPIAGYHVGAGCLFTRSELIRDVPIDPWLYFHGEEQNLAIRAWTHGWDIWHVPNIPIYHLYHTGKDRPLHWDSVDDAERKTRWWALDKHSTSRMQSLLYQKSPLGVYGLGTQRTLEEFSQASGVDYLNRTLHKS